MLLEILQTTLKCLFSMFVLKTVLNFSMVIMKILRRYRYEQTTENKGCHNMVWLYTYGHLVKGINRNVLLA